MMRIRVLGSAAGGGAPQWNCACGNCTRIREHSASTTPLTQESVVVSSDGRRWILINASPDIRQQIESFAPLHPRALRDSPIRAVMLTSGDLDHCLGLLMLREWQRLVVYATERVWQGLVHHNIMWRTFQRFSGQLQWHPLRCGADHEIRGAAGEPLGLSIHAFSVPGKVPLHLETLQDPHPEDTIGVTLSDGHTECTYVSGAQTVTEALYGHLNHSQCLFFDGTFWSHQELRALGITEKTSLEMGHLPVGGDDGSLVRLADLKVPRRIYIHINNTNPLILHESDESQLVRAAGWEVAHDGMELVV